MSNDGPTKQDIEQIFNRLRAQIANKSCFDCAAKNPTWSSVTYGVFICIDCSAVHRSLGVHLSFVRSTNLDTNWTWVQLRQMQLGGNANASQFFRQHNCNTTDAQQKYNSRAAQLYRDKLQAAAIQAMKIHGTKLFLDTHSDKSENETKNHEEDFFAECSNDNHEFTNNNNNNDIDNEAPTVKLVEIVQKAEPIPPAASLLSTEQPSVDFLNSPSLAGPPKSIIGVRKIQPKRAGLGARKGGLGATKVKANFEDIEHRASLADQHKEIVPERKLSPEEEQETVTSVRLAYQDLSIKKSQEEEKLKAVDPAKAKQLERLGMGFNLKGSGVSHSVLTDMQTITQTSAPKHSLKSFEKEPSTDFFDEYSTPMYTPTSPKVDSELSQMGWETIEPIDMQSNISTMFSPSKPSSINEQPGRKTLKSGREIKTYENDTAQKKFGNAKGISSDQFFGNEQSSIERATNLSRFQGSSSISSADYFGDGSSSSNTASHRGFNNMNFNAPDLEDVRESVRQGVTKVAGKLSTLANDVMSSIQDKYGY